MSSTIHFRLGLLLLISLGTGGLRAAHTQPAPDLAGYRTVATAITTSISTSTGPVKGQPGYLGLSLTADAAGKLTVSDVIPGSPAEQAGVAVADQLLAVQGKPLATPAALREVIQSRNPGDPIQITVSRRGQKKELSATLAATSRPMRLSPERGVLGVRTGEPKSGDGALIDQVTPGLPAAEAGLKKGDVIQKVDGAELAGSGSLALRDALAHKQPGDTVTLEVLRRDAEFEVQTRLVADPKATPTATSRPGRPYWSSNLYRLAVIPVEFTDAKHNPAIPASQWARAMFSRGTHTNTATGQPAYGSLNDYYLEQSCGAFRVEGRVFDHVPIPKKRADFFPGTSGTQKTAFFTEVLDALLARDGAGALRNFDGLCFIYAGDRYPGASRGSLYWPHKQVTKHRGTNWTYMICPEGGSRMNNISVFCHEFGHMLGLPDLYARPENPGSEGVGVWCAMSNQSGGGRPQHFSAWCKEQLGWLKPVVIDPSVPQKLLLAPVENAAGECFKVLVRPDGSEHLLLENRRRKGFDQSLPGDGLLIWRVLRNKPVLEESHGVDGPDGPRVFLTAVPYPSGANNAFTPYTTPSSRSHLGGGAPVHLTQIRRLPDGRIAFQIGYEYD